ncbi:hypothetical protein [Paraburkholderia sp. DHOC27]|uniref:hypothetical protein n=1 Tax=Paraburkholderia sp. DHOC27 TaxID=2303330 RepID=UPI000E3BC47E|nr:hypothetical protein [Paraburkholderia sp. DHOC27]RFU45098.1 hypothetical protein D0B32_25510 [Paraburkholderia sp. DHOC27]
MKLMFGLLALLIASIVVILYAGSYGEGVIRMAGYVATIALGGLIALMVQGWKSRRAAPRPPR